MAGVPLILRKEAVHRTDLAIRRPTVANIAIVYADADGRLVRLEKPPKLRDALRTPYRIRYEVDISDQERSFSAQTTPLPAKGDVYAFENVINVGFRVTDPIAIVRRNVTDALPIVYPRLIHMMRGVTRRYEIHESAAAERAINELFAAPVTFAEGITVYHCQAHLAPDRAARRFVVDKDEAVRSADVNRHRHVVDRESTQNDLELIDMRHRAEIDRRTRELSALGDDSIDYRRLLQLHLVQHPEDTERVLSLLVEYEQTQDEKRLELFQFMIQNNLVSPVDVDSFRKDMLSGVSTQPRQSLPQSKTWIEEEPPPPPPPPLPAAEPEVTAEPEPAPEVPGQLSSLAGSSSGEMPMREVPPPPRSVKDAQSRGADSWDTAGWDTVGGGLLPFYVVVEESVAVRQWLPELDEGVTALCRAVAETPPVAARVRLTVLGFASDVREYLSRADVRVLPARPHFSAHDEAHYGPVFADLLDRIGADIPILESSGQRVHRPTVVFLTAGRPADGDDWRTTHRQLIDRQQLRSAPNIIACGIGELGARTVNAIASRPGLAFIPEGEADVRQAIRRFFDALVHSIVQSRGTLASDPAEFTVARPEGFRLASEVI